MKTELGDRVLVAFKPWAKDTFQTCTGRFLLCEPSSTLPQRAVGWAF